ncbi:hypothetical protein ACKWTF_007757 [Chironomus riparius]
MSVNKILFFDFEGSYFSNAGKKFEFKMFVMKICLHFQFKNSKFFKIVKICAIQSCKGRGNSNIPIFELPESSIHRGKWIDYLKYHEIQYIQSKKYFLCVLHFCHSMVNRNAKRVRLDADAFPSLVSIYKKCYFKETIDKLIKAFVEFRKKLQYQGRFMHKRNEFASKNN